MTTPSSDQTAREDQKRSEGETAPCPANLALCGVPCAFTCVSGGRDESHRRAAQRREHRHHELPEDGCVYCAARLAESEDHDV